MMINSKNKTDKYNKKNNEKGTNQSAHKDETNL